MITITNEWQLPLMCIGDNELTARIHRTKMVGILSGAKIVYDNLIQLTLHFKTLAYFTFVFIILI